MNTEEALGKIKELHERANDLYEEGRECSREIDKIRAQIPQLPLTNINTIEIAGAIASYFSNNIGVQIDEKAVRQKIEPTINTLLQRWVEDRKDSNEEAEIVTLQYVGKGSLFMGYYKDNERRKPTKVISVIISLGCIDDGSGYYFSLYITPKITLRVTEQFDFCWEGHE